jgi:transcriptional regulator of aromatic amino acid metabolism
MMAFDRSANASSLDPAMVRELRDALARSVQTGNHGEELKDLLSRAAADARQKGLQAEQLLLALKDIWYSLPQLSAQSGNEVQTRLLQQLIARCIQEYYAT